MIRLATLDDAAAIAEKYNLTYDSVKKRIGAHQKLMAA